MDKDSKLPKSHRDLSLVSVGDLQFIAKTEFGKELTDEEIGIVEHRLHKYIDFAEAICICIEERLEAEY